MINREIKTGDCLREPNLEKGHNIVMYQPAYIHAYRVKLTNNESVHYVSRNELNKEFKIL